jgi:excisionase family DNA binding protein
MATPNFTAELKGARRGERGCDRARNRAVQATLGGSNRLLSVGELADYLGVPKKTVYARWQEWGLKGYKVRRHLRFHVRHVEDWLQRQEV